MPRGVIVLGLAALAVPSTSRGQDVSRLASDEFTGTIRPLVQRFCVSCHSTEEQKGDLDLEAFTSFEEIRRRPLVWRAVEVQLAEREMPPRTAPQPDEAERALLLRWLRDALAELALERAGDPGPVVLRRLTNAEYTYTLRDLTGLSALAPAHEFPVDGAAGEGFTNVGNALVMSPSLLAKYLASGKGVAEHAVLLPDGFRFSPNTTQRDWTEELLGEIRAFYRRFTAAEGGDVVDLQGIVFATNGGGRLPLARYFTATLELREAAPSGTVADSTAIEAVALRHGLSAKYLATLLGALRSPSALLEPIAAAWRDAEPASVPELVALVEAQQAVLWKFNSVGHIGKVGGPAAWLEPVEPPVQIADGADRASCLSTYDEFRRLFPAALCYAQIVPVDEVVTLTQFHREDAHLVRLVLDDAQAAELDRLWAELHFVSEDALTQVDAFEQLWQYATQDADPAAFEPLRQPISERAAAFRALRSAAEPRHLEALARFAERAYRRPLTVDERDELDALYRGLRAEGQGHAGALRLMLARVLVSPSFLYRAEFPPRGAAPGPVSDWELASRLSYFLWSTAPDEELRASAARGTLHDDLELRAHTKRMLRDPRVRRLAIEFGCAALHIHGFDERGDKSERHFPTFAGLRSAMYEESILFLTDLFQRGGSLLELLAADHTFLNAALAEHYGIPGVEGDGWRRVDGVGRYSRGGILSQATVLASQSGASRTSPILRGNWLSEVLLGEKLPKPPKDVPRLPDDESQVELTMRELTEQHTSDPSCAKCHARIDPYGFSLEAFDAIGRHRLLDLGGRPIDTRVKAMDGAEFEGLEGLRAYLLTTRRDAFVRQFCRKLLGYSLGRAVRLSDEPLLAELCAKLAANGYQLDVLVESLVLSRQFREIRGLDVVDED